jgi:TetR/AcrR family transcriptional regulator, tetracycline repressor protein
MPRPSKPLIRRDAVVEASLRIIDTEGLDALSLPRLAREFNVQAPSLYHHFEDKAEILKAVARAVVVETRLPDPKSVPNWIEWLVALSLAMLCLCYCSSCPAMC